MEELGIWTAWVWREYDDHTSERLTVHAELPRTTSPKQVKSHFLTRMDACEIVGSVWWDAGGEEYDDAQRPADDARITSTRVSVA